MWRGRVTRSAELLLALAAFAVALITAYEACLAIIRVPITRDGLAKRAPVGFLILILEASVIVLGLRLAFVRMRPRGRIIGPSGIAAYVIVWLILFVTAWLRDNRFPPHAWPILGGAVIGFIAFLVDRRGH